jgi:hypothetical protein
LVTSLTQIIVEGLDSFTAELLQFLIWNMHGSWRLVGQHPREIRCLRETEKWNVGLAQWV